MTQRKTKHADTSPPSADSLREMPEIDFERSRFIRGRGPEALANASAYLAAIRGRPRKGAAASGSKARSLRLPDAAWLELERRALERKLSVHALLRQIVAEYLYTRPTVPARRPEKKPLAKRSPRRPRRSAARRRTRD